MGEWRLLRDADLGVNLGADGVHGGGNKAKCATWGSGRILQYPCPHVDSSELRLLKFPPES